MTPGSVLFHKNFQFPDGGSAPKLLVVLSAAKNGQLLVVKTTSQQRRRPLRDGCHPDTRESVYVFNANLGGFKTTTWVILDPIVIGVAVLTKRVTEGTVMHRFTMNSIDIKSVINCLKKCDEVSPAHLEFLV